MNLQIYFNKISSTAIDPLYSNGGYKLYSDQSATVNAQSIRTIRTGITVKLYSDICFLRICSQETNINSTLISKSSIGLRVSEETIPDGYPHELRVNVFNFKETSIHLNVGDCIAQIIVLPLIHPPTRILKFIALTPSIPTENYIKWRDWYLKVNDSNNATDVDMFDEEVEWIANYRK